MLVFTILFTICLASFHRVFYVFNTDPKKDHWTIARHRATPMSFVRVITMGLAWSISLIMNVAYHWPDNLDNLPLFHGLYSLSFESIIICLFICIIGFLLLLLTTSYAYVHTCYNSNPSQIEENTLIEFSIAQDSQLKPEGCQSLEYILVLLFSLLGGLFLITSKDLISLFISLELQSYALYILAVMNRKHSLSASSGLKYFLLGGLSSGFILLGCAILYINTGLTNLESIYLLVSLSEAGNIDVLNNNFIIYNQLGGFPYASVGVDGAILIILVGFLFKISAAPFHNWSPDVYDGVPTIVTTWLTIIPKISLIYFITSFIVHFHYLNYTDSNWNGDSLGDSILFLNSNSDSYVLLGLVPSYFLFISSFLSLTIGSLLGLTQTRIKRLFAYSSISNIGFILLSLGISTIDSIQTVLFYLIQYTIANLNVFFILIAFGYLLIQDYTYKSSSKYSPISLISQLKGQWYFNSFLVLSLSISLFSLAGIPPFIGFYGKLLVILSALNNGYYFLTLIAIVASVISAAYYLNIIKIMFTAQDQVETNISLGSANPTPPLLLCKGGVGSKVIEGENSTISPSSAKQGGKIWGETRIENSTIVKSTSLHDYISLVISLLTLIISLFFFRPEILLNISHIMALNLFTI